MRDQLRVCGVCEAAVDDAVLILSELLSNACRHGRPLREAPGGGGDVLAAWRVDATGRLTVEVTDGGGPTRPVPAKPSITARGGRGLNIITALADDWGVRDGAHGGVTVWVIVRLETAPTRTPAHRNRVGGHGSVPAAGGQEAQSRVHSPDGTPHTAVGAPGRRTGSGAATAAHAHRPGHVHPPGHRHGSELAAHGAPRSGPLLADRETAGRHDERG
jgi:anti-sigma regulatory factor (Ser/Thr protein kinase)